MSATTTVPAPRANAGTPTTSSSPSRGARVTAVAWAPEHDLAHQQWLVEGKRIGAMSRGSAWWVGDWLMYGTARWGERYAEASRVTGYDPKTLRNMRYVASRFHLSLRKDNLTFSHHALLAGMEPDEQRHWLDRATRDRMSVEDLRIELRTARREAVSEPSQNGPDFGTDTPRPQDPVASPPANGGSHVIRCPHCGEGIPLA